LDYVSGRLRIVAGDGSFALAIERAPMSAFDPVDVLRDKMKEIDGMMGYYAEHIERLKRERIALMVAIAALEQREASK
jgi:hypothetical protein